MGFDLIEKLRDDALARSWRGSQPFSHLIVDDFVSPERLLDLRRAIEEEPMLFLADELYQHRGSVELCSTPLLREFGRELGSDSIRARMQAVTGLETASLSIRAYRYSRGDYLLPHSDSPRVDKRKIAFAFYLGSNTSEPMEGGELQLYRCEVDGESITKAAPDISIAATPNRIVLFAVGPGTLHRVCEITHGERLSLAGWFVA